MGCIQGFIMKEQLGGQIAQFSCDFDQLKLNYAQKFHMKIVLIS